VGNLHVNFTIAVYSPNNFASESFYILKLCSRLFVRPNCPKDDKFRYFIPILRTLGAA